MWEASTRIYPTRSSVFNTYFFLLLWHKNSLLHWLLFIKVNYSGHNYTSLWLLSLRHHNFSFLVVAIAYSSMGPCKGLWEEFICFSWRVLSLGMHKMHKIPYWVIRKDGKWSCSCFHYLVLDWKILPYAHISSWTTVPGIFSDASGKTL